MSRASLSRGMFFGVVALAVALVAVPARAQGVSTAAVKGKVVDDKGAPIAGAKITLTDVDKGFEYSVNTNSKGEFLRAGLVPAHYKVTIKKDALSIVLPDYQVTLGDVCEIPLITLSANAALNSVGGDAAAAKAALEAHDKKNKELQQISDDAKTAYDDGKYDDAIDKLNLILKDAPKCATCYHRLADAYVKKGDFATAETNYKKATELDPKLVESYLGLSALYTQQAAAATDPAVKQQKQADAAAMTAKATELASTVGGAAAAATFYNQGVELWNQGKSAEAQPLFEKAIAADPKLADAHYLLGMALLNQGKMQEAVKPLQTYLTLAPTGKNADTVKAVLASIKL